MAEPLRELFRHLNHSMNEMLNVIINFPFIFTSFYFYIILCDANTSARTFFSIVLSFSILFQLSN